MLKWIKKIVFIIHLVMFVLIGSRCSFAQDPMKGDYTNDRSPIPYYHLREADVMWSKKIWRILDLREKLNHPLYYPTKDMDNRKSLMSLLLYGFEKQNLILYDDVDDEFTTPTTMEIVNQRLGAGTETKMQEDLNTGEMIEIVINNERKPEDVKKYLMKETWFFDKQRAMLDVRIIGLCPLRLYYKVEDVDEEELQTSKIFWVYFPSIRPLLANHEVFNATNDAERGTFDDIFFKRMFSSYIFQETNVYDNRLINQYALGLDAILESEKIKEDIFRLEHDLWEY